MRPATPVAMIESSSLLDLRLKTSETTATATARDCQDDEEPSRTYGTMPRLQRLLKVQSQRLAR